MELIDLQLETIEAEEQRDIARELDTSGESRTLKDIAKGLKASLKNTEGFTRLDALNRIGNQVFALDANKPHNFVTPNAPVNYPHIWTSSWFEWVQYDGSIMQPMVRNAGEALGVAALVNLEDDEQRFDSTVKVDELHRIEQMLAGTEAPFRARTFTGLKAPAWPEAILGVIDRERAAEGRSLYRQHCQGCHLPATDDPAFWSERYWSVRNDNGERLLRLKIIPAGEIGTDPAQSRVLADRRVDTTGLGIDTVVYRGQDCTPLQISDSSDASFAFSLGAVVQETTDYWYRQHGIGSDGQQRMNGFRPNCLQAPGGYKARPLNGIWATAPFLHNGSVPNLHALLSPASERPERFWLGNREFDPVRVGYETGEAAGLTELDTRLPGNHNGGHEFRDGEGPGIIGPLLSESQRMALIEYLKTL
ncbi:di-heme-cytochrome C peroxidase [Marinobacterium aestuariivivens]|uniref:Di-heme-cytochrome C peroxidase n=1 Tax=Marinobacterium aestuariivivens TaxID=1698799 RepID=A0ABW1ZYN5_9GAMM